MSAKFEIQTYSDGSMSVTKSFGVDHEGIPVNLFLESEIVDT